MSAWCGVGDCVCGVVSRAQDHHEARHPAVPWVPEVVAEDVHAKYGGTTQGVAVRGSKDENKLKAKGLLKKSKEQWWEEEGKTGVGAGGKPGAAAGRAGTTAACDRLWADGHVGGVGLCLRV